MKEIVLLTVMNGDMNFIVLCAGIPIQSLSRDQTFSVGKVIYFLLSEQNPAIIELPNSYWHLLLKEVFRCLNPEMMLQRSLAILLSTFQSYSLLLYYILFSFA